MKTATSTAYRARAKAIADSATVRTALGQAAHHRVIDGRHVVSLFDRTAGKMRTWSGTTLDQALAAAMKGGPRQ
jgi:hypothetical protein